MSGMCTTTAPPAKSSTSPSSASWSTRHGGGCAIVPGMGWVQSLFGFAERRPGARLQATDEPSVLAPSHDGGRRPCRDVIVVKVAEHDARNVVGASAELFEGSAQKWRAVGPAGIEDSDSVGAQPQVAVEQVRLRGGDAHPIQVRNELLDIDLCAHGPDARESRSRNGRSFAHGR